MIKVNLAVVMAQRGIKTQTELAEKSGLTKNTITNLAQGYFKGSIKTLDALCKALNCQPGEILVYVPEGD